MRIVVCTLALVLTACGKSTLNNTTAQAAFSKPSSCTQTASNMAHSFVNWGAQTVNVYNCPLSDFSAMTCTFYETVNGRIGELRCENTSNSSPQTAPAYCQELYPSGPTGGTNGLGTYRVFFDGTFATADAIKCGSSFGLTCTYFEHRSDASGAFNRDNYFCD